MQNTIVTTTFPFFLLDKNNRERKKKRENKITCEYERDSCCKSCQNMVVQISFFYERSIEMVATHNLKHIF